MNPIEIRALPAHALLARYEGTGAYTDCHALAVDGRVPMAAYVEAFYTSPAFKPERWLLGVVLGRRANDADAAALAAGHVETFSAWRVEARAADQIVLATGRTRSWLMVAPRADGAAPQTTLFFGSAVLPRAQGGLGWTIDALTGFHKLYSRVLLRAAAKRIAARSNTGSRATSPRR
jgi:hypothetical protein